MIVEWPDKLAMPTDWPVIRIEFEHVAEDTRRIVSSEEVEHFAPAAGEFLRIANSDVARAHRPMMWNPAST